MKKLIALILVLLLAATTFAGCSGSGNGGTSTVGGTSELSGEVTSPPEEGETEKAVSLKLPDGLDYEDQTINILVRTSSLSYHEADETASTIVGQAVYNRNSIVEDLLGVHFHHSHLNGFASGQKAFMTAIRNSIQMGDEDSYHIVSPTWYFGNELVIEGCYQDLQTVEYVDLTESYWWDGYGDYVTLNGKTYNATGDFSVDALECMLGCFFNTTLAQQYGFDPYSLVNSGDWTVANMMEMCQAVSTEDMGSGLSRYGLLIGTQGATALPNTCGSFYITKNEDDSCSVTVNNEKNQSLIDIYNIAIENGYMKYWSSTADIGVKRQMFTEGYGLFMMGCLQATETLRNSEMKYGVLPYPKYDTNQTDYISGTVGATVFAIPIGMSEETTDMCGAVLQACAYYSYHYVTPAYFETTLKLQRATDPDSYNNLELIRSTVVFDFAHIWMNVVKGGNGAFSVCLNDGSSLTTWYAKNGTAIETALGKLLDSSVFKPEKAN